MKEFLLVNIANFATFICLSELYICISKYKKIHETGNTGENIYATVGIRGFNPFPCSGPTSRPLILISYLQIESKIV